MNGELPHYTVCCFFAGGGVGKGGMGKSGGKDDQYMRDLDMPGQMLGSHGYMEDDMGGMGQPHVGANAGRHPETGEPMVRLKSMIVSQDMMRSSCDLAMRLLWP